MGNVRLTRLILIAAFALTATAFAQESGGLDLTSLDKTIDPCADFYQYTCSTWNAAHPIPPDRPMWGSFMELSQRNENVLRGILDKVSADDPKRSALEKQIGDFYYACMDEKTVNAKGHDALKPELVRIDVLKSKHDLQPELVRLRLLARSEEFHHEHR